jgi:hypothetical protein
VRKSISHKGFRRALSAFGRAHICLDSGMHMLHLQSSDVAWVCVSVWALTALTRNWPELEAAQAVRRERLALAIGLWPFIALDYAFDPFGSRDRLSALQTLHDEATLPRRPSVPMGILTSVWCGLLVAVILHATGYVTSIVAASLVGVVVFGFGTLRHVIAARHG